MGDPLSFGRSGVCETDSYRYRNAMRWLTSKQ